MTYVPFHDRDTFSCLGILLIVQAHLPWEAFHGLGIFSYEALQLLMAPCNPCSSVLPPSQMEDPAADFLVSTRSS